MPTHKKNIKSFILFFTVIVSAIALGYGATILQNKVNDRPPASTNTHKQIFENEREESQQTPLQSTDSLTSRNTSEQISKNVKEEERREKALQNADYLVSYPSQGSLIQKQSITIEYNKDGESSALVSNEESKKIRPNQNIILYDKNRTIMPLGGTVKSIIPRGETSKIIISLPEGTKTQYLLNNADIITLEARVSIRFPLSALQKDKNENYYVWSAEKTEKEGEFQVYKTWLEFPPLIGEDSFVAGNRISVNNLLVLDPDKKIKDNEIYKTLEVKYSAPYHNPIKQAYHNYWRQKQKENSEKTKQKIADCRKALLLNMKENGCGAPPKATPMDIFNSILLRQPEASTPGNCGASSSSCGSPP